MKWVKLLRRTAAFFLAAAAVWWLTATNNAEAESGHAQALILGASPSVRTANLWEGLVVGQSPYLRAGQVLVGAVPSQEPEDLPPEPTPVAVSSTPAASPAQGPDAAPEDDTPLPSKTQAAHHVVAQTLLPATDGSYPSAGGVFLYNRTNKAINMEKIAKLPISLAESGNGPQILIVHTHATEAYTQDGQDIYEESDPYRTTDDAHNVVRVGDEMASAFAQAGLNVLHDRTLHDYPNYNGAYTRSRATVEEYLEAYPSIALVLDVHRDALEGKDGTVYKVVVDDSVLSDCAQVMLVVGTDQNGAKHPDWQQNLALAMALERSLNEHAPTLARPIVLRGSHFNQDLSPGSLLVEVGTHGNTLQEAICAARNFAQLTAPVIRDLLG